MAEKLRPDSLAAFYCAEITFPTLSAVNSNLPRLFLRNFSKRNTPEMCCASTIDLNNTDNDTDIRRKKKEGKIYFHSTQSIINF